MTVTNPTIAVMPHPRSSSSLLVLLLSAAAVAAAHASGSGAAALPGPAELLELASGPQFREWLVSCRRHLHTIPELFFQENDTSAWWGGQHGMGCAQ